MIRYAIVSHTYEGLAGETTDNINTLKEGTTLDEAMKQYDSLKKIVSNYLDSFVWLVELDTETFKMKPIKEKFALEYAYNEKFERDDCIEE